MDKSFDLDNFKFPGVAGISHNADYYGFGTNKASGTPLNFDEMADDTALCFAKQRAEVVSGNMTITKIDYDIKLIVENGVEVTLPTTNVPNGISATFIPNFAENESATIKIPSHTWELDYTTSLTLSFDGTTWKKNSLYLPEREEREDMRNKINIMLNSCYTGRDLRKVLFELGDFNGDGISNYEEITCPQVMEKLHIRCQNNNFSGLGLGDWVDHDSITIPPCLVTRPGESSTKWWGSVENYGFIFIGNSTADGTYTLAKNDIYHNTRLRIASFGCGYDNFNSNSTILFEYENIPFEGYMNGLSTSSGDARNFVKSSLYQWLNYSFYNALNESLGNSIIQVSRYFYKGQQSMILDSTVGTHIFLPDSSEVFGYHVLMPNNNYNVSWSTGFYSQWPIYSVKSQERKKNDNGFPGNWWLSSCSLTTNSTSADSVNRWAVAHAYGYSTIAIGGDGLDYIRGISPAFCIG